MVKGVSMHFLPIPYSAIMDKSFITESSIVLKS